MAVSTKAAAVAAKVTVKSVGDDLKVIWGLGGGTFVGMVVVVEEEDEAADVVVVEVEKRAEGEKRVAMVLLCVDYNGYGFFLALFS